MLCMCPEDLTAVWNPAIMGNV